MKGRESEGRKPGAEVGIRLARYPASLAVLSLLSATTHAVPLERDFAQGIEIVALEARPLVQVTLPDEVYQQVTRADLGDLRVFNAQGEVVPHGVCAAPASGKPQTGRSALPVFELQAPERARSDRGTHVDVETTDGTQVRIREAGTTSEVRGTRTWAHIIDARSVNDPLHSIEFDWVSPDGASQAEVRIEASDDLDRWQTIVPGSTLLRVMSDGQQLQRKSVPLPVRDYDYLRVVRTDGGPPLQLAQVIAESVAQAQGIEPLWFRAQPVAAAGTEAPMFDTGRLAPVTYVRLVPPRDNVSLRVTVQSRSDASSNWRAVWTGESYSVVNGTERLSSPPAEIAANDDRYWRIVDPAGSQSFDPAPALELGYRPAQIRFLAQGSGPYVLAFGSRRAEPARVQPCDSLLADLPAGDRDELIAAGSTGAMRALGGETALKPLPKKTPVRQMVFWGVLIAGVGMLVAMAMTLFRRMGK